MQPYVIHRILNQRVRMSSLPPEPDLPRPPIKPSDWEPDSDAYDTELEDDDEAEKTKQKERSNDSGIGARLYRKVCQQINSAPQTSISHNLSNTQMCIPERYMGASNLTGLMAALLTNNRLTHLDLSNNSLGFEGGREISTVLIANNYLQVLNLSSNKFGANGVSAYLSKLLSNNRILKELNISFNGFNDEDAKYLSAGLEANEGLVTLDLSHNDINEEGASYLGKAIAANDSLENLDLSWNSIRRKGGVVITQCLKRNYSLKRLNLAWNGLGYDGTLGLKDALSLNKHLIELDISNNRINWEGALFLAEILETNTYLEVLKVGGNPLTTTGCLDMIDALDRNENTSLRVLDLQDIPVVKDFVIMTKRIQQGGKPMEFHYGEVVPHHDVLGERSVRKIHPMQKIINYMYEKEMRPLELLRSFDKDGKFIVTEEEFLERLLAKGIDIKSWERDELMAFVSGGGFGEGKGLVNYKKLVDSVVTQIDNERNFRIGQREHGKAMQRFHDKILQTALPPLNVDAALVQITGVKRSDLEKSPKSVALRFLAESITERSMNSFSSKMALAKNVKLVDTKQRFTPKLTAAMPDMPSDEHESSSTARPTAKVLMTSPLNRVKAVKSPTAKLTRRRRSKSAQT